MRWIHTSCLGSTPRRRLGRAERDALRYKRGRCGCGLGAVLAHAGMRRDAEAGRCVCVWGGRGSAFLVHAHEGAAGCSTGTAIVSRAGNVVRLHDTGGCDEVNVGCLRTFAHGGLWPLHARMQSMMWNRSMRVERAPLAGTPRGHPWRAPLAGTPRGRAP
eukprot:330564-Chlamydomonas_euryale.AAC.2